MSSQYFIVKKDTPTHNACMQIHNKALEIFDEQKLMAEKYGFNSWRPDGWAAYGGLSACEFEKAPNHKVWKRVNTDITLKEFMPKENSKEGKVIKAEFNKMTTISRNELGNAVGYSSKWNRIGFSFNDVEQKFGFVVGSTWDFKPNDDHIEVTLTAFKKTFKTS